VTRLPWSGPDQIPVFDVLPARRAAAVGSAVPANQFRTVHRREPRRRRQPWQRPGPRAGLRRRARAGLPRSDPWSRTGRSRGGRRLPPRPRLRRRRGGLAAAPSPYPAGRRRTTGSRAAARPRPAGPVGCRCSVCRGARARQACRPHRCRRRAEWLPSASVRSVSRTRASSLAHPSRPGPQLGDPRAQLATGQRDRRAAPAGATDLTGPIPPAAGRPRRPSAGWFAQ